MEALVNLATFMDVMACVLGLDINLLCAPTSCDEPPNVLSPLSPPQIVMGVRPEGKRHRGPSKVHRAGYGGPKGES